MKRRDFLTAAASAGLAGTVLPRLARGAAAPCAPGAVSIAGGMTSYTTCISAPPGTAPAWFLALAEGQWTAIADGSGNAFSGGHMISQVLPSPLPKCGLSGFADSPATITQAWTGAFLDQNRVEYGFCASGGHDDYCGNETYVLSLGDPNQPAWRRITTPSPTAAILASSPPLNGSSGDSGVNYGDGYARAMHNSYQAYLDGRVWMAVMSSVASASGNGVDQTVSFNRDSIGAAVTPASYVDSKVWQFHGPINNPWNFGAVWGFGFSIPDAVNHRVWALPAYAYGNAGLTLYSYISTSGTTLGQTKSYSTGQNFGGWRWGACADDLQILIAGDGVKQKVAILNLANPGAGWTVPAHQTGTGVWGSSGSIGACPGAVYDSNSHCVYVGDPPNSGDTRTIYKLQLPVSNGVYQASGTHTWSAVTCGGPAFQINTSMNTATYTKFNMVQNMGNGQKCLVYCPGENGPTYVLKVPLTGL